MNIGATGKPVGGRGGGPSRGGGAVAGFPAHLVDHRYGWQAQVKVPIQWSDPPDPPLPSFSSSARRCPSQVTVGARTVSERLGQPRWLRCPVIPTARTWAGRQSLRGTRKGRRSPKDPAPLGVEKAGRAHLSKWHQADKHRWSSRRSHCVEWIQDKSTVEPEQISWACPCCTMAVLKVGALKKHPPDRRTPFFGLGVSTWPSTIRRRLGDTSLRTMTGQGHPGQGRRWCGFQIGAAEGWRWWRLCACPFRARSAQGNPAAACLHKVCQHFGQPERAGWGPCPGAQEWGSALAGDLCQGRKPAGG